MIERLRGRTAMLLASPWTLGLSLSAYLVLLLVVLFPVLASSVGADDSYWLMEAAPDSGGSFRRAFWDPFLASFAFDAQARMTGLSEASRWVLALAVMKLSVAFSVPPVAIWALLKVFLLVLALVGAVVFLRAFRFRGADGGAARFGRTTIVAIVVLLPLLVVLGAKTQSIGTLNGWLNYPTITYGPFGAYLLLAAAALAASRLLDARFSRAVVPVAVLAAIAGVAVSFDYELMALSIPLVVLVLLVQPAPVAATRWARWRGRVVVGGVFALAFATSFAWIRVRISQMTCESAESCYSGTVLQVDPATLVRNLLGALPGGTGEFLAEQAERSGTPVPTATAASVLTALGCVLLAALVLAVLAARTPAAEPGVRPDEARGLLAVVGVGVVNALGATAITGISQRAVESLTSGAMAYRSGVVVWTALAFALAAALVLAWTRRRRIAGAIAAVAVAVLAVAVIATSLPANVVSAQVNRVQAGTVLVDTLHAEVALGDLSAVGDERRCDAILAFMGDRPKDEFSDRFVRTVQGAYRSFQLFYAQPFCSTKAGLDATTGS